MSDIFSTKNRLLHAFNFGNGTEELFQQFIQETETTQLHGTVSQRTRASDDVITILTNPSISKQDMLKLLHLDFNLSKLIACFCSLNKYHSIRFLLSCENVRKKKIGKCLINRQPLLHFLADVSDFFVDDIIETLILDYDIDINESCDRGCLSSPVNMRKSCFLWAHIDTSEYEKYLNMGLNPNLPVHSNITYQNKTRYTKPIDKVALYGDFCGVKLLLSRGAEITAECVANSFQYGNIELGEYFLRQGVPPTFGDEGINLILAIISGHDWNHKSTHTTVKCIKTLLNYGAVPPTEEQLNMFTSGYIDLNIINIIQNYPKVVTLKTSCLRATFSNKVAIPEWFPSLLLEFPDEIEENVLYHMVTNKAETC